MDLVISGQDIRFITLGLLAKGSLIQEEIIDASPETYLMSLSRVLKQWNVALEQLSGIVVITGPGSFTATRVSTTIANALAFSLGIPIVGVQNPQRLKLGEVLAQYDDDDRGAVTPSYDRAGVLF